MVLLPNILICVCQEITRPPRLVFGWPKTMRRKDSGVRSNRGMMVETRRRKFEYPLNPPNVSIQPEKGIRSRFCLVLLWRLGNRRIAVFPVINRMLFRNDNLLYKTEVHSIQILVCDIVCQFHQRNQDLHPPSATIFGAASPNFEALEIRGQSS